VPLTKRVRTAAAVLAGRLHHADGGDHRSAAPGCRARRSFPFESPTTGSYAATSVGKSRDYTVEGGLRRVADAFGLGVSMIQRKSAAQSERRRSSWWWWSAVIVVLAGLGASGSALASGPPRQLVYRVTHSVFGDIGTYTNTIEPAANGTLVSTQANFDVRVLGVNMYHERAQRTERWQGNRLVAFDGVTDKGHGPVVVKGVARGNEFVITSPQGTFDAPASVRPANPWSANFLSANEMMRVDTGRVEPVRVSGGEEASVTVGLDTIATRKYEIDGNTKYTVWLDAQGVPVQFAVDDNTGKVTFVLAKCVRCGPASVQLGAN
jgi:Family of unknown function (DUF6134)